MSELTQCNYCRMKDIEARARKTGKKIVKVKSEYELGGVEIHLTGPWDKPTKINWVSWMMEIPDHCVC